MTNQPTRKRGTREWHRRLACASSAVPPTSLVSTTESQSQARTPVPLSHPLRARGTRTSHRVPPQSRIPTSALRAVRVEPRLWPTLADVLPSLADPLPIRFFPTAPLLCPTAQNRLACFPKITKTRFSETFGNPQPWAAFSSPASSPPALCLSNPESRDPTPDHIADVATIGNPIGNPETALPAPPTPLLAQSRPEIADPAFFTKIGTFRHPIPIGPLAKLPPPSSLPPSALRCHHE